MRFVGLIGLFLLGCVGLHAQQIDTFSVDEKTFIREMEEVVTANKSEAAVNAFKTFENQYKNGLYPPEEIQQVRRTGDLMLSQGMRGNIFALYLEGLSTVKDAANGSARFQNWHQMLDTLLVTMENRKVGPYSGFLKFSNDWFTNNALRANQGGLNWTVRSDDYEWVFEEGRASLTFSEADVFGYRRQDSIAIYKTGGTYYPDEGIWKGTGGEVTWERFGLSREVNVVLTEYEIEVKKSIYSCEEVTLSYPDFFGARKVQGKFEDKISATQLANGGSYPRFESFEKIVRMDNIGEGIRYVGGFRLQGTTVYGYGSKNLPAELTIQGADGSRSFAGYAELFTIRQGERIVAEEVESAIYFGQDSISHPSVNIRFEIPDRVLQLRRGEKASDRNPFFSSMHNVNIDVDQINYYLEGDSLVFGEKSLIFGNRKTPVVFESTEYFEESDYNRFQNIATYNPIAVIKGISQRDGVRILDANYLAQMIDSRFSVENIQSLLYDLVAKGFISYDPETQEVELKDKIFHYVDASQGKVDFDALRIQSETEETNAVFDLKRKEIVTSGVQNIIFSRQQNVGINPYLDQVVFKENRNMDFDGRMFAGYGVFSGKDYHFNYDGFNIQMDSVRYFDLYLPTGQVDENGKEQALSLGSRIEHASGVLLIDAPRNKSGKDDIEMFPSFQSKSKSYVFYDNLDSMGNVYKRDSFYFELKPFSFNSLDRFGPQDIEFDGELYSAGIFPVFKETLRLMDDQSLGFTRPTPEGGYEVYDAKGEYGGEISLSNRGFLGNGRLTYLGATINSNDFVFKPKRLTGSAERFDLEEDRVGDVKVPQVRGVDVDIDWRPYRDSMYITSQEAPFEFFQANEHQLKGTMILTPTGVKGRGNFSWSEAEVDSRLLSFGANSVSADTMGLKIKAFDAEDLALRTKNLNGVIDFDTQQGTFNANAQFLRTELPYNQYETSMNEFDWDMKNKKVIFRTRDGQIGKFLSTHPDQDSLFFRGKTAAFDLKTSEIDIGGVPYIVSADAYIYPVDGNVKLKAGGNMDSLFDARIVADTLTQFHVINRARVKIKGKKDFNANGYYEYNIGNREQEILFQNIIGQRVGKGSRAEKRVATRATGEVTELDRFYIDHKTEFRGTISLSSDSRNLEFNGFARLEANTPRHWFTVNFEGDRSDLTIIFDEPKNYDGQTLRTGLYLSKETARVYPRIMAPLYFRKDRPVFPVKGGFNFDEKRDVFVFADTTKIFDPEALKGNKLTFYNYNGKLEAEGRFYLGQGLKYISMDAAGTAETLVEVQQDSSGLGPMVDHPMTAELMLGINLILPDELLRLMDNDLKSSSFDVPAAVYANEPSFYRKAISELFPTEDKDMERVLDVIALNEFDLPKKLNDYTFLFAKVPMKWDPDYQSFISTEKKIPLASFNGEMVNRVMTTYIECKMPTNDDDRLYIYLRSGSGFYYFFGFKQGILNIVSNNTKFNDAVINMKDKDRIVKMGGGETYEIQPVNEGTANSFVRRVEAAAE